MPSKAVPCSCGVEAPHPITTRKTLDNFEVSLWNDGGITGPMDWVLISARRTLPSMKRAIKVGEKFLEQVGLYNFDWKQLKDLYKEIDRSMKQ